MKNKWAKIMATVALFGIMISTLWTWLIIIFSGNWDNQVEITQEQIEQIQQIMDSQSWAISSWTLVWTWELTWTWEIDLDENIIEIN